MNDSFSPPSAEGACSDRRETRWPLRHLTLAGLHWPGETNRHDVPPVVMLHGWLDNSLSFVRLAPELSAFTDVYAVDLAGHGRSDHRPEGQSYLLADYVADLAELIEASFSEPVDLVGHSLGGIVAMLYAAAFPEKVRKLVVIDSLGPISKTPDETVSQLRKGILKRLAGSGRSAGYLTVEEAAAARAGGLSPLSAEAAMQLVPRNLREGEDGFEWRTDPRLRYPSLMMFAEQQALACLEAVITETLLLRAEQGLLADRNRWQARLDAMPSLTEVVVSGTHHCHLDGDITPVADAIRSFLSYGH